MKHTLSDHDRNRLDTQIADTEKRTNTQIVLASILRCDSYAELPWKAFALGASVAGMMIFILDLLYSDWYSSVTVIIAIVGILAGGALFALLTVLIPSFAKRFLSNERADVEVRQYAEAMFLSREIFATKNRTGILVLISTFERKVVILPDNGLSDLLPEHILQNIIATMAPFLKQKEITEAFEAGLAQLSDILGTKVKGTGKNELSDDIIEEKGV